MSCEVFQLTQTKRRDARRVVCWRERFDSIMKIDLVLSQE